MLRSRVELTRHDIGLRGAIVVGVGAVLAALVVSAGTADAAVDPLVALPDTVLSGLAGAHRTGSVDATQQMTVAIDLKLRDPAGLAQFDTAVATPGSPFYGHYLTGAQFATRFGPSAADVGLVRQFLTVAGLKVTAVSGNSQVVDATGTAGALSALFHTTLSTYENGSRTFFANDDPVQIPATLAPVIEGVVGLDNRAVMTPAGAPPVRQAATTGPVGGLSPSQVDSAYRFGQLGATGSGVTVALWEFDGYKATNLTTYDSQYGVTGPAVSTISVDRAGYDAAPSSGEFEVEEDSEIVSAIAPAATQVVYEAPNTGPGSLDMANKIVSDGLATVISISWGECEAQPSASYLTAINNAFSQAAAEGISIYSASGDRGSRDCTATPSTPAVDFPGSSVYDTSVGGTKLTLGTGGVYSSETAWANGGGGVSSVFAKPGWQTVGTSTMRTVPDVSAVADPASSYSAYIQGAWTQAGGTSAAAPAWAAFTALYNQKAETAGKADLGFANPALYQVAGSSKYATALHDVTTGSNGDYTSTTGYDETTGLGTPIGDGLAAVLGVGANVVTVTSPGNQSTAVGTAVNLPVQAADTGTSATLTYAATGLPAGLSINATTGTITGKPTAVSSSTVTITATDNTKIAGSAMFTWTVIGNTVNVTNPGGQSTVVGTAVNLAVQAADSGTGTTLTYAATGLPAGLTINATTGAITGKPTTVGTSSATVTVTDNTKAVGTAAFSWTVVGNTVTVANPGNQSTTVNTAVSLAVSATDTGTGATLTYAATGLPAGLTINATTGAITGKPTATGTSNVVLTVTDNTKSSGTASFTWTVTAASTCTAPGQKITNPGFESGNTGWSASTKVIGQYASAGEPARTGTWVARLDGYGTTHTDIMTQSVTIPKACSATLSFYLHIDTAETTKTSQYDTFTVKAGSTVLGTFSNLNAASGYTLHSYNMTSYAGQAVTLTFTGTGNSSLQTSFVLDDTSLTAS